MKKWTLIVLAVLALTLITATLCGCAENSAQDANGVYVNVEVKNGTANVEVLSANDGKFSLDTFIVNDVTDSDALTSAIITSYGLTGNYAGAEELVSKEGDYTYKDNAFIPQRLSLIYSDGQKEFCYLKNGSSFELSPTIPVVLLYCLLGFAVTLFVLVFLMFVIKLLSLVADKIQALAEKKKSAKEGEAIQEAKEEAPVYAKGAAGEIKLVGVSERDAAMIMAIVADQTDAPINTLKFISITDITDAEVEK